jgi:murein L,D-transpeptidase YafK
MKILKYLFLILLLLFCGLFIFNSLPEKKLPKNTQIDSIIVFKNKRQLQAWENGILIKKYSISLGKNPIGAKEIEGDNKTPEGIYTIFDKNPQSDYHNNLGISYPNLYNIEYAKKIGKSAGFDIKIHGMPKFMGFLGKIYKNIDWTAGCIAVTNDEIDEIAKATKIGTKIILLP